MSLSASQPESFLSAMIRKLIYCPASNEVIPIYQRSEITRAQDFPGVEWSDADLAGASESCALLSAIN